MLACLRAMGMGIEDMRTYQANRARDRAVGRSGGSTAPTPFTETVLL